MVARGGPPYGVSCDMWSLGSVLYSLLSGQMPQGPLKYGGRWKNLLERGQYDMRDHPWPTLSADAWNMVRSLMCVDICQRLSAEGCLRHCWLSQSGPNMSLEPSAPMSLGTANKLSQGLDRWFGQYRLNHFRKTALHRLAQQGEGSKKLQKAFDALDKDNDGQVSLHQLVDVLAEILPGGEENESVIEWRNSILPLLPENAALSHTEFLAATMDAETCAEEYRWWDVFSFFDRDRDGTISVEDLENALPGVQAQARHGFADVVAASGGRVTFEYFVQLMKESLQRH
eukprot:UN1598